MIPPNQLNSYDDMLRAEFGLLFEESDHDDEKFDGFWTATIIKTAPLGATKYWKEMIIYYFIYYW